jgi:lysophospholipase L1-like esterase
VGFGKYTMNEVDRKSLERRGPSYLESLNRTYGTASREIPRHPYWIDLTDVFAEHTDVYRDDGRHLTQKGNAIIAAAILDTIRPILATSQ